MDSRVGLAAGNLPAEDTDHGEDIGPVEGIDSEDTLPEADTAAVVDGLPEDIVAVVGPAIVVAAAAHHMAVGTDQRGEIAAGEPLGADIHQAVVVDKTGPAAVDGRPAEHTQRCYKGVAGVRRRYTGGAT